jgi:hypothetical protein
VNLFDERREQLQYMIRKKKLTSRQLKNNVSQLKSYMDQINQSKGILAIYNFSNTVILAPRKWFGGRILIICINMCELSPSKRNSSIEIIELQPGVIDLIELE